ncbi:MAG TPA: GDP-mannose 4,6-dehydratase [Caulobacteraceae bacterium]|nr:GDP-mannose 4,6-dehydratase [Caulobacteraceae bacterium]
MTTNHTKGASEVRRRPRSILVTGADGFVGRHLCPRLAQRHPAVAIVALRRQGPGAATPRRRAFEADIGDAGAVREAVRGARPDLVIHLAAQASAGEAADAQAATWRTNVEGTRNLAAAVAELGRPCDFIFASSGEVYGLSLNEGPARETTPLAPLGVYARSKAEAEAALAGALAGSQARAIVCRAFNHTGPGQDERFVVPRLAAQVARIEKGLQRPVVRAGDLSVRRDFLDVRDVVEAYLDLADAAPRLPALSTFNIASGRAVELIEVVQLLQKWSRRPFELEIDRALLRPADVQSAVGDAGALRAATGWRPRRRFAATVRATLEYFRKRER